MSCFGIFCRNSKTSQKGLYKDETEECVATIKALEETLSAERRKHQQEIAQERGRCDKKINVMIKKQKKYLKKVSTHLEQQRRLLASEKEKQVKEELKSMHESNEDTNIEENMPDILTDNKEAEQSATSSNQEAALREAEKEATLIALNSTTTEELEVVKRERAVKPTHNEENLNELIQEVQSLQIVLEMKQEEIRNLRLSLAKSIDLAEKLEIVNRRHNVTQARCEELTFQLRKKRDMERKLLNEAEMMEAKVNEETCRRIRLEQELEKLQLKIEK